MSAKASPQTPHDEPDTVTPPSGKPKNALRHDLGNELAVVSGFSWLALTSLRQLSEKLEGPAQAELQTIISMVERVKTSAEQGRKLLIDPASSPAAVDFEPIPAGRHRVLAVDDSLPLLALLNKVLTRSGYEVETFIDPKAALQRFAKSPDDFDIVVTDEMMPDMTGAALTAEIRAIRPAIPVVLCTGAPEARLVNADQWTQAIIRKPYRPRDLTALVHSVIADAATAQPEI